MERNANTPEILGPSYQVRVGDLREWHVLGVRCAQCGHDGRVPSALLKARLHESTRLNDAVPRFRCQGCGMRGEADWAVYRMRRD